MSGSRDSQKVKYTAGSFVGKLLHGGTLKYIHENHAMVRAGHAAYIDRFHELARLVPHLVTPENKRIKRPIGNHQNQVVAVNGGQGRGNNDNQ
nr:reverse transcriptase domain-containing protein [Tanacetum cinerariifolium]